MKFRKIMLTVTTAVCLLVLSACNSENQETVVRETVVGFYTATQAGDYSGMKDYVTRDFDSLEEFLELGDLNAEDLLEESVEDFGLDADDFTDETMADFENLLNVMIENVIRDYEITEISVDGQTATAIVEWTTAYADPSSIESFIGMGSDMETLMTDYMDAHKEELTALEETEGETVVIAEIYNALFPNIFTEAAENVAALTDVEMISEIVLEQQEETWLIAEMKGIS